MHIDHGGAGAYTEGVAISLGYKSTAYGSYTSRIVNYLNTGVTQATKLQLQTQAGGGTTWNTGILIDTVGNVGINNTNPQYKLDVYQSSGIAASFGGQISVGSFGGIHFGYVEIVNTSYRKSALVFERTDGYTGQGGNAGGKIHFLLNNNGSTSATSLSDAVMTIDSDSSGTVGSVRVGIGTRNPTARLQVSGSTNVVNIIGSGSLATASLFSVDGNNGRLFEITDDLSDSIFSANTIAGLPVIEAFSDYSVRLGTYSSASGSTVNITGSNVGIGTIKPSTRLHTAGSTRSTAANEVARLGFADSSSVALFTNADTLYGTLFGTLSNGKGWIQQQRVDGTATAYDLALQPNGGNVGIGVTDPGYRLDVIGRSRIRYNATDGTAGIWYNNSSNTPQFFCGMINDSNWGVWDGGEWIAGFNTDNTLTVKGDIVAYGTPSDSRLKDIKEKVPNALDTILKLNGYKFDWKKSDSILQIKEDIGVIAQEVEEVAPELVRTNEETGMKSVRYQGLTAILIEAIKELKAEIDILKNK